MIIFIEFLQNQQLFWILLSGVFTALAASFLGAFIVAKKMALVGDVLSHVALPGIGLALIFNIDPMYGAATFLILAALGTWFIEKKTALPPDAIIGAFFTATLALGVLLVPDHELFESMFGNLFAIKFLDAIIIIFASVVIFILTLLLARRLALSIIAPDLAKSIGAKPDISYLGFLLLFALSVALGIKLIGSVLMGALTILPAISARNLSWSLRSFLVISVIFGVFMTGLGIIIADIFNFPPGPAVIILGVVFFIISLFFKKSL
ncbi:MAG: metal ABC transporter permease [Candidatus Azambacteria bacterium]|nr:metal ABC transporter permease [Candidatus Azambacteria bacterium]